MTASEIIGIAVGVGGLFFALSSRYVSGMLSDKKDSTIHSVEIQHLKEQAKNIEKELEELKKEISRLEVLEREILHLKQGKN